MPQENDWNCLGDDSLLSMGANRREMEEESSVETLFTSIGLYNQSEALFRPTASILAMLTVFAVIVGAVVGAGATAKFATKRRTRINRMKTQPCDLPIVL